MSQEISEAGLFNRNLLSDEEATQTARYIADLQLDNGMIPWFNGGHADPWNHIEAVVALCLRGLVEPAIAGLRWLASVQNLDGSICQYFLTSGVKEPRRDLNACAYLSVGYLACLAAGMDERTAAELWPHVEAAIDYVTAHQFSSGAMPWAVDPDGYIHRGSLLTGCSSIYSSIEAAELAAQLWGIRTPRWSESRKRLRSAIQAAKRDPELFLDKSDWAMDGYYPALVGALEATDARLRLRGVLSERVVPGWGVRCVMSSAWTTAAETSEMAIALALNSMSGHAETLLSLTNRYRDKDGSYFTGYAFETGRSFPGFERSSYTAAAVLIADSIVASGLHTSFAQAIYTLAKRVDAN